MNESINTIMTRTSVRSFSDTAVPPETIETLLRAAMAAPSAKNRQPWHFFVICDKTVCRQIAGVLEYGRQSLMSAAYAIIVAGDSTRFFEEPEAVGYWVEDCSAAAENLLLAAHALGLGAVWCGVYPIEERVRSLRDAAGIDSRYIPMCIIPIGYPDAVHEPKDKWDPAKVSYLD